MTPINDAFVPPPRIGANDTRHTLMTLRHLAPLFLLILTALPAAAQQVTAHVFWQEGCPYCNRARAALAEIAAQDPALGVNAIELGPSADNNRLFQRVNAALGIDRPAVPLVVIGARHQVGFAGAATTQRYRDMVALCREVPCPDRVADLRAGAQAPVPPPADTAAPPLPETVTLPLVGEITLDRLSLPALTVVLAGVDGFNPCAMWVLALLIGLLLGVEDRRRMWTLGAVFLLATGAMYFAVMAAWLNVVLWIGAAGWLRLAIGALALAAGVYYLREYWTNPEGVCRVTPGQQRRRIRDRLDALVNRPGLALAALGVAALAVVVNLVELLCSAGVPAVYTQVLAMHDLPAGAHYGYLALYLGVFLLDDTAIFVTAMVTLRAVAATGRFSRISHLVGGVVLLALGAVMVLRPDLLG
ncbi:hypothetical protein [Roseovarius salinarum]|uniref:hypothetical protein n=1 Tax=Roseovarius salinarum TaxID=1981892 RepID=UPI0012FFE8CC|nr:hypothetical protein [Roseovarius salinarum]